MYTSSKQLFVGVVALFLAVLGSQATPVIGADVIVASDGYVIARFEGHTAGYSSDLYLVSPDLVYAFNNQTTPVGTEVNLGYFTAGTELIFSIYVRDTGFTYYSGDASRNPDGIAHAAVDDMGGRTLVGFEDLFGGGDRDYDDLNFSFSNTRSSAVPDVSSTLPLLGLGLGSLAMIRRLRK